ncbi:MAG TPA: hypothetical protein VK023_00510 [Sphingobacterium bovisgrunnientis]|jgi:hypothetical protein|uniref:hypothetical protein n=1 Tax=Sphingobacterium bovisgrunnientis TaxID=1874697 RepID=UPI001357A9F2|nr:hypothetical protein [Sphingobacterium bovisgrunnientis]HLS36725.1 hypothetical protein [Sphingobacterium bovisgrunnientis]
MLEFNFETWYAKDEKPSEWLVGNLSNLNKVELKTNTKLFLLKGFPRDAPLYIFFNKENECLWVESITKGWLHEGYDNYIQFGSDGAGNPICIDLNDNDSIWILDHDNDFEEIYINQKIDYYAQCLLVYKNFLYDIADKYGDDAWYDGLYKENDIIDLKKSFEQIDKTIFDVYKSYWRLTIDDLLAFMKT